MNNRLVLLFVCLAFAAGFILGDRPWERIRERFGPFVISPKLPRELYHFHLEEIPEFSSDHFFFRDGFTDVDEYWSFCLAPDLAEAFLKAYVEKSQLTVVEDTNDIPDWVLGVKEQDEWDGRYWFSDYRELDQIYYKKYLFCGYSADRNRLYLMNWND
ncbi:hypothetical protein [Rosistilla oblonga]|uniref:hypothetical protein n=1 Tax=Rosistilla oblonga TaxID=2527990 RepID=UPI003A97CFF0